MTHPPHPPGGHGDNIMGSHGFKMCPDFLELVRVRYGESDDAVVTRRRLAAEIERWVWREYLLSGEIRVVL